MGSAPPESPEPEPRATHGTLLARARAHDRLDLLGAPRQHGGRRERVVLQQPVGLVGPQLVLLGEHPVGAA